MNTKTLSGHVSSETAYFVSDYPYGYRLRCQIRYWIETTKHGQRVVSQTTNPKRAETVWNKPKASTYSNIRVLFLDENEHVQNASLSFYDNAEQITAFEQTYDEALTSERDQKELRLLKVMAARSAATTYRVVSAGPVKVVA